MNQIKVEKCDEKMRKKLEIPATPQAQGPWSVWECDPSRFDWKYSDQEVAYLYEGKVKVKTPQQEVELKSGDLVTFPKGLSCTWEVQQKVRKVYKFE